MEPDVLYESFLTMSLDCQADLKLSFPDVQLIWRAAYDRLMSQAERPAPFRWLACL